jgi:hypothetical protein
VLNHLRRWDFVVIVGGLMKVEQMREQVDKVCRNEADFEETMNLLDTSIAASPDEPEFLRMRIELLDAAYDRVSAWKGRNELRALLPDDLDNHLAILRCQHRYAHWIANDFFAERNETASPEDEEALAAIQAEADAYVAQLQSGAVDGFLLLMQTHAGDVIAARQILDVWNDTFVWSPWNYYTMILQARAAHPHDASFKKDEAKFLVSICDSVETETDNPPIGYFDHLIAGRLHAVTIYQALAALDAVDDLRDDPELLKQKAQLLLALDDYAGAAASFKQAAQAYENALKNVCDEEREAIQTSLDDVLHEAAACDGGRAGVCAARFAMMEDALKQARNLQGRFGNVPDDPNHLSEPLGEAESAISEWETVVRDDPIEPTAEELETLDATAAKLANTTMSLVSWERIELSAMEKEAFQQEISPWFDELKVELGATGLQLHGWFQNPANVAALKCEAPGQYWLSPDQDVALVVEATHRVRLKRCVTEFSDGSLMLTADARGGSYWLSGPFVRSFSVFKSTPVKELQALHKARVAAHLAMTPGLKTKRMDGLSCIEEFENKLRAHSREFRLANGITDAEIRGMNVKFNDYFSKQIKREVAERIAVLKENLQGRTKPN